MRVERVLPTEEAGALLELTRELAERELAPRAAEYEQRGEFPRDLLRLLGRSGLLGLPYPEEYGGGGQPYEVYLQVIEELAYRWLAVAEAVSVHTLACHPLAKYGTDVQRKRRLPDMLGGELLGALCLSEPQGGSDAANLTTRAVRDGEHYSISGTKAWITHAGARGLLQRLLPHRRAWPSGVSCLLVDADTAGVLPQARSGPWGCARRRSPRSSSTARGCPPTGWWGRRARLRIAMAALDAGRLGIAACAVGLAQAALDHATGYAREREQFGTPIIEIQGLSSCSPIWPPRSPRPGR